MLIVGIDPGFSGGIVAIDYETHKVVDSTPIPTTEHDIATFLNYLNKTSEKVWTYIEKVHSFPGQGVASSFKFGKEYGFLRACLICNDIPFEEPTPQCWQKYLEIPKRKKVLSAVTKKQEFVETKTEFKNRLKGFAQQLFPKESITLATADAFLIAEYGRRKNKQFAI